MTETFDYIVIGGGSADCVVANRLPEAGRSMLELEDGPTDNHSFVHITGSFFRVVGTKRMHLYRAEACDTPAEREMGLPQSQM